MRFLLLPLLALAFVSSCADDADPGAADTTTATPTQVLGLGEERFRGEVLQVNNGCEVDAECSITVRLSEGLGGALGEGDIVPVITMRGESAISCLGTTADWGSVRAGATVEVFAGPDPGARLSLCGSEQYYVRVLESPYDSPCHEVLTPVGGTPTASPIACAVPVCTAAVSPTPGEVITMLEEPCPGGVTVSPTAPPPYNYVPRGVVVNGEVVFRGVVMEINDDCDLDTSCWASILVQEVVQGEELKVGDMAVLLEEMGLSSTPCYNEDFDPFGRMAGTIVEVRAAPDEFGMLSLCPGNGSYERVIGGPTPHFDPMPSYR